MPHSYVVADHPQSFAHLLADKDKLPSRKKYGIPESKFVFCNFSRISKIGPKTWALWMRILKRTPNAMLWLLRYPADAEERIYAEGEKLGVRRSRIKFSNVVPKAEHVKRCYLADVFLDALEFNACSTACDVLFSGTPMISMLGQKMAARTGASILTAAGNGLEKLVVRTVEEYEDLAVKIASDLDRVWQLRQTLEQLRAELPIFDSSRHCRNMEKAYKMIWRKHEWGERPDHITVPDTGAGGATRK
jgi:protein O-GlcNAc transferase